MDKVLKATIKRDPKEEDRWVLRIPDYDEDGTFIEHSYIPMRLYHFAKEQGVLPENIDMDRWY